MLMTFVTRSSSSGLRAMSCWWTGWVISRTTFRSSNPNARLSSVTTTEPSMEFSMGTRPSAASPRCTALRTSRIDG